MRERACALVRVCVYTEREREGEGESCCGVVVAAHIQPLFYRFPNFSLAFPKTRRSKAPSRYSHCFLAFQRQHASGWLKGRSTGHIPNRLFCMWGPNVWTPMRKNTSKAAHPMLPPHCLCAAGGLCAPACRASHLAQLQILVRPALPVQSVRTRNVLLVGHVLVTPQIVASHRVGAPAFCSRMHAYRRP